MERMSIHRSRVAISISPSGRIHQGHLRTIAFAKTIARRDNLQFHFRWDDIYASNCKDYKDYPQKNERWGSGNPHVPVPGRAIWEMIRPPAMTKEQLSISEPLLDIMKPDLIYTLSEIQEEARDYLEKIARWLADLPIYFTEDLIWGFSYIVRGKDWDKEGLHGYWSEMQRCLLNYYAKGRFKEYLCDLLYNNGEKISQSSGETEWLSDLHKIKDLWERFLDEADTIIKE